MEYRILGPLEVRREGRPVTIPPRERAVLAVLLLHANSVVAQQDLLDELWGEAPPPAAKASLQNAISGLRRALGAEAVETSPPGYRLVVEPDALDALRFETLLAEARAASPEDRVRLLREALACWRGPPLAEFPVGRDEIARLEELRLVALELRVDADLALGRSHELVAELDAVVRRHPLRERLWAQLMLALYRSGRQAEALATYRRAHEAFRDELGIEPGPELKDLQLSMLVQDRRLEIHSRDPVDVLARAAPLLPTRTLAERAESLLDYSVALWRLGERDRSTAVLERAADEADRARDRVLAELVRVTLAQHALARGEIDGREFVRVTDEAVRAAGESPSGRLLAKLLVHQGVARRNAGRGADAARAIARAVELAQAAGDLWQEGWCRNQLGLTLAGGPMRAAEALRRCEEHLAALEWGSPGPIGLWASLGMLHAQLGSEEAARTFAQRAVEAAREAGVRIELAGILTCQASTLEWLGDPEAETPLRVADDLLTAAEGAAAFRTWVRAELARFAVQRGSLDEAESLLAGARSGLLHGHPDDAVGFGRAEALLELRRGRRKRALVLAREAVSLADTTDFLNLQAGTLEVLAQIEPASGALDAAGRLYERKGNLAALTRLGPSRPSPG